MNDKDKIPCSGKHGGLREIKQVVLELKKGTSGKGDAFGFPNQVRDMLKPVGMVNTESAWQQFPKIKI